MAKAKHRQQIAGSRNPVARAAAVFCRASVVPDKRAQARLHEARRQCREF